MATTATSQPTTDDVSVDHYTLHMFPFSLYSIMSRFAYVLGKTSLDKSSTNCLHLDLRLVNLHRNGNISEEYLTRINAKGQVPAMTGDKLTSPLTDSLDISYHICKYYPHLLPPSLESVIRSTLSQLHQIHALPLSVPQEEYGNKIPCEAVDELLGKTDTRLEYRQALEFKKNHHENMEHAISLENVRRAETKTRELCSTLMEIYQKQGDPSGWLFGKEPTVLDAHVVAFFARLLDVKRDDLIPGPLREYTNRIRSGVEWDEVVHGRSTIWTVAVGHVHLLDPM